MRYLEYGPPRAWICDASLRFSSKPIFIAQVWYPSRLFLAVSLDRLRSFQFASGTFFMRDQKVSRSCGRFCVKNWLGGLGSMFGDVLVSLTVFSFGRFGRSRWRVALSRRVIEVAIRWLMSVARWFVVEDKDVLFAVGTRFVRAEDTVFRAVSGVGTVLCCLI